MIVEIGVLFPKMEKPELPRWNLRQADWSKHAQFIEENVNRINPTSENYIRFIKLIKITPLKAIPRGHGQNNIPCWLQKCELLFKE